jgi:hypothetical protein
MHMITFPYILTSNVDRGAFLIKNSRLTYLKVPHLIVWRVVGRNLEV